VSFFPRRSACGAPTWSGNPGSGLGSPDLVLRHLCHDLAWLAFNVSSTLHRAARQALRSGVSPSCALWWQHVPTDTQIVDNVDFGFCKPPLTDHEGRRPFSAFALPGPLQFRVVRLCKTCRFAGRFLSPADRWPARTPPRPAVLPLIWERDQLRLSIRYPASGGRIPGNHDSSQRAEPWRGLTGDEAEIRSTKMGGLREC